MAIKKLQNGVQVGDFIRGPWGYRMSPSAAQVWRKVIEATPDGALVTVDRNGTRREFGATTTWKKFLVWEPGDPREDGDNL